VDRFNLVVEFYFFSAPFLLIFIGEFEISGAHFNIILFNILTVESLGL